MLPTGWEWITLDDEFCIPAIDPVFSHLPKAQGCNCSILLQQPPGPRPEAGELGRAASALGCRLATQQNPKHNFQELRGAFSTSVYLTRIQISQQKHLFSSCYSLSFSVLQKHPYSAAPLPLQQKLRFELNRVTAPLGTHH